MKVILPFSLILSLICCSESKDHNEFVNSPNANSPYAITLNSHSNYDLQYQFNPYSTTSDINNDRYLQQVAAFAMNVYAISRQPFEIAALNSSYNFNNRSDYASVLLSTPALGLTNNWLANPNYLFCDNSLDSISEGQFTATQGSAHNRIQLNGCPQIIQNEHNKSRSLSIYGALNVQLDFQNKATEVSSIDSIIQGNWQVVIANSGHWILDNFESHLTLESDKIKAFDIKTKLEVINVRNKTSQRFNIKSIERILSPKDIHSPPIAGKMHISNESGHVIELIFAPSNVSISVDGQFKQRVSYAALYPLQTDYGLY